MKPFAKSILMSQGVVNPLLLRLFQPHSYDLSNTIIIAGAPRSGTTWLAEVVNAIPCSSILFEPLNLDKVPSSVAAGFNSDMYLPNDAQWEAGKSYMASILRGKIRNSWTVSHIPLSRAIRTKIWIVKFVRANMFLGWICHNFVIRPPVLIIRHPCATIASQLRKGWLAPDHAPLYNDFMVAFPQFINKCKKYKTMEEFLAAWWCMRYYAPLVLPTPRRFEIISYEKLVNEGANELKRIFKVWMIDAPELAFNRLSKPSKTTANYSQVSKGSDLLTGWKNYISSEQEEKILSVVSDFGLDFYNSDIEPDYDRLYGTAAVRV